MQRISAPIIRNERGQAVQNLQEGLLLIFTAGQAADPDLRALLEKLTGEQRDGMYGDATTAALARFQREQRASFSLPLETGEQVDEPTAAALNSLVASLGGSDRGVSDDFQISGRVEFEDGSPAASVRVDAYDRGLGANRLPLSDNAHPTLTAEDGVFPMIRYRPHDSEGEAGRAGPNADLVFEIVDANGQRPREITALYRRFGNGTETQVSDLVLGFEATKVDDVRIVLTGRPREGEAGEYTRLMQALAPLLVGAATPADFDQERFRDVDFAARESGWSSELITTLALAWRLAKSASREPQLLAETFYGLLREGAPTEVAALPGSLDEILDQNMRWAAKLQDSLAHHLIDGDLEQHLGRLRDLRAAAETRGTLDTHGGVGDVLTVAGFSQSERDALLGAFAAHSGTIDTFWNETLVQRGWTSEKIQAAQTAIQLADVLSYDMPLLSHLRSVGVSHARDLVQFDQGQWADLVKRVGPSPAAPGATPDEQIANTVNAITAVVDATFPTQALARLATSSPDPQLASARDLLSQFFERETAAANGTGFDVRTTPVTSYLEENAERVFSGMRADDKLLLTSQLQRLQRAFRLGVDRAQTQALLDLKLDSAFHVTRFSPEHFGTEFGEALGGAERALRVYGRAEQIAGTVLYMYTDLWQGIHGAAPMTIMSSSAPPDKIPALKELPAYKALFGSLELCSCDDCQSVYSPAAYFVDLLHMLDRPSLGAANPVEVLFARRPDLAHIQLTCDNTNTRIPYVDLVTEVLEAFIANRAPTAFNIPPPPPNRRLPSPSADELRVNPVYLTAASSTFADKAYAALQDAVFPLTLPLNLALETTRAYLENLGVSRAALMALFDRDLGLEAQMARAAEILRLAPEEFELISGAEFGGASALRPATTAEFFGLTTDPTATTAFNHAAPEFVKNIAAPDQRSQLIRSLQNTLNIISPTPVPVTGLYDSVTEAAVNAFRVKAGLAPNGRTDDAFWGATEADKKPALSVILCPVPMLLERSGVTYEELVALVKTRFINPTLQGEGDFDYLARLGMPAADVRAWIEAGLPVMPAPILAKLTAAGEDPATFTTWVKQRTRSVVINTGFESPCDLDRAILMHLDGTLFAPQELVTLFRFIRLWRKLGWTIQELDLAIEPGGIESSAVFNTTLLLANVKQLRDELGAAVADVTSLWQTIQTFGDHAVYDRLFRNRTAQLIDPILELNPDHTELKAAKSATPPALSDHLGPVLAGLRLSAPDLELLRNALKLNDDPSLPATARPPLDLTTLSMLHRHVTLGRVLRVSIRELLALLALSGLHVFDRPDRVPRGDALGFADLVAKVKASGIKIGTLIYLCRAEQQLPAPPTQYSGWTSTLAAIIDGLHALASEQPIEDDAGGEQLTARLTEVIGPDEALAASALMYGQDVYSTPLAGLPATFAFPAALSARLTYDAAGKTLRLSGAMTAADRALLLTAPGVPAAVQLAYEHAIKSLDAQPRAFVARALLSMYSPAEAEATLIDISSLDAKGAPMRSVIDAKIADVMTRRRAALTRSLIKQTLTTATGLNADVVALLLENAKVLNSLSGADPAIEDYRSLDGDGLDAGYFANPDLKGAPGLQRVDPAVGFDLAGAAPAPGIPAAGFSVLWTGQIYVPAAGEVSFRTRATDGILLKVNGATVIDEWRDQPEMEFNATLRLDGSRFYPIEVRYYNKTGGALLELSWRSPSIPAGHVPQSSLYTSARFAACLQRVERMYKLALLLVPFALTARDVQALAEHGDLALDLMPVAGPVATAAAQAMFAQWLALYDFAALRDRYPSAGVSLMDLPTATTPELALTRFADLSGAPSETLHEIVEAFTVRAFDSVASSWSTQKPDLTRLAWWGRFADALDLVQRSGAAPQQLLAWAKSREIKELAAGPATQWFTWMALDVDKTDRGPRNALLAQAAKNVVRARYDEIQWQAAARALNDALRIRRRSALTAFVLAMPEIMRARISTSDRLFEFFFIDVEMDPCMETSRIKQGISSVQLFTQSVLLDLQSPLVPPSRVDAKRWESIKIFPLWVADRKVLFHPEAYMSEALRDDKTPLFTELESELLQDRLTDANAERAFRHYIEKLDGIAKLIVCGTCIDKDASVLHVFGRTATAPYVFYHRRLDNKAALSWTEGVWSPWQRLAVDVATVDDGEDSGTHLMPIVWNRRVYLFWMVFESKPDDVENAVLPDGFERINLWHIKLAWSEYKDGQWSPKQTGVPFLVSHPVVISREHPDAESFHSEYTPNTVVHPGVHIHRTGPLVELGLIPRDTDIPSTTDYFPHDLSDVGEATLSGIVLKSKGDAALHDHQVVVTSVASFLPKPAAHYFDSSITGDQLTIRVFGRFKGGTAHGQARKVVTDTVSVIQDGRRTDRREHSTETYPITDSLPSVFEHVGTFHFPACGAHLDGVGSTTTFPYESLVRPSSTINSFMALRNERGANDLRLTKGAEPILKSVPDPFDVIDSDNRSGFDRNGPFFYQDQRRCYFVTRETYFDLFNDSSTVLPDSQDAAAKRAGSLALVDQRHAGMAAEADQRVNPWAHAALEHWSNGPGLTIALRTGAPLLTRPASGSFDSEAVLESNSIKNALEAIAVQRPRPEYTFTPHWHPYTCAFLGALNSGGLPALFTLPNQSLSDERTLFLGPIGSPIKIVTTNAFETTYKPDPAQVAKPYPLETVDFSRSGAYALNNWEIFFHAPARIAAAHYEAGDYEAALRWFHFVFAPMTSDTDPDPARVWRFLPFRTADTARIEDTVGLLSYTGSDPVKLSRRNTLQASIQDWIANPFNPFIIARRRPVVFMKHMLMKYLDNLFAWADKSPIDQATQLLVLASNLLGPRPQRTPAPGPVAPETFQSLRPRLDALSNAQVDLETRLPFTQLYGPPSGNVGQLAKLPQTLYFCMPQDDKMLAYWDTLADRLFKLRHCMDADGNVRDLPLFDPPIDPMLLVEAVAHGIDIGSVLDDLYAPLPRYRFTFMLQQALAMCNEVRTLGNTLLPISEKLHAEELANLRAGQETLLLDKMRTNKKLQVDEAEQNRQALDYAVSLSQARIEYLDTLVAQGLISEETDQLGQLDQSNRRQEMAGWIEATAQALNLIPNTSSRDTTFGGSNLGAAASAVGRSFANEAAAHAYLANRASITGGHARRMDDWRAKRRDEGLVLAQAQRQRAATAIHRAFAEAELNVLETQIEQSHEIQDHLRKKFTNESLYRWMEGKLRAVYFQSFQQAYKTARGAQRTFQYQLGTKATFVTNASFDTSVRGMLAGECLYQQLKEMERAYYDTQGRELEISKEVSLEQLDPIALIALKETGSCEFEIPEWLFDIDYAGCYFRRIKSVSLSIPAVIGRGVSMNATLTLLSSKVRESSRISGSYGAEENYRPDHLPIEAIAVSSGHNDSGRFQLDFRDEKFLPFEGAGLLSKWRIDLPKKFRSYDYHSITNPKLQFLYTTRRDATLAEPALAALEAQLAAADGTLFRFFSLRHEFPSEWQTLRSGGTRTAIYTITKDRFPVLVQSATVEVAELHAVIILNEARPLVVYKATLTPGAGAPISLQWPGTPGLYRSDAKAVSIPITAVLADSGWQLQITAPTLAADIANIRDILIAVRYSAKL